MDLSLRDILSGILGLNVDSQLGIEVISNCTDSWMAAMKARQNGQEEKLERFHGAIMSLNIAVQGAKSVYKILQESIKDLTLNTSEIWQLLASDEHRISNLESMMVKVEDLLAKKMYMIQEWFEDITTKASLEIPREIVNSIQEVINGSGLGIAVDSIRDLVRELRQSVLASRHAIDGLREFSGKSVKGSNQYACSSDYIRKNFSNER